MPKRHAVLTADASHAEAEPLLRDDAVLIDFDDVAQRRERLEAYAEASRPVIVYGFVFPAGARIEGLGAGAGPRDAHAQLELIVGLTGGSIAKSHGGLAARIPRISAARFESLARPLIEAFLVSLDLGQAG
ncbi:hypothetical protein [Caulobacter sp. UNC279MFTsu5.1]|uniref:hypothetical protein n=1 Tax=Caulobacter sp. UNC279MFTsu5.1 TaxID=1502775 RepID=UPI00035E0D1D|nr:hypothetical protein [Caulobacter sp. UNC279MFTsu5.1]SFJ31338.1 hypothetical protein SAMN02799626_01520 [Caulobacter sp. UNC279MFTsu5.1]